VSGAAAAHGGRAAHPTQITTFWLPRATARGSRGPQGWACGAPAARERPDCCCQVFVDWL